MDVAKDMGFQLHLFDAIQQVSAASILLPYPHGNPILDSRWRTVGNEYISVVGNLHPPAWIKCILSDKDKLVQVITVRDTNFDYSLRYRCRFEGL